MNVEKPELYAVFPYRIFGVDKPDIQSAIQAFNHRINKEYWGWQQDGIFAALLGLTDEAKKSFQPIFQPNTVAADFLHFGGLIMIGCPIRIMET